MREYETTVGDRIMVYDDIVPRLLTHTRTDTLEYDKFLITAHLGPEELSPGQILSRYTAHSWYVRNSDQGSIPIATDRLLY